MDRNECSTEFTNKNAPNATSGHSLCCATLFLLLITKQPLANTIIQKVCNYTCSYRNENRNDQFQLVHLLSSYGTEIGSIKIIPYMRYYVKKMSKEVEIKTFTKM